ncbi:Nuclear transport factor 2 family protein with RNA binding domain isoform 1 [Tripterygium wilfordii]|uniref:Nuclear transport factor 2 family protein with RNA binding domain isoform 1 n=1 Tax=Tripterygium wilfordii TaxID=458696 RepID=A0A7J7CRT1_TRIWF|nr:nuclear transport factor 2-like [Tripterygium wilfordii]XP_038724241.1 nuclear transport factor 2-like [Tripterygium wilfordii]KAF5736708.1 Nuclear transport factor 2 family protein with RNA binding domain isoform 1 [Tripterygium wilfordii]
MATPFSIPVTAAQVGTYFVGQYYQVLQSQPDFVHQFFSDASTMLRIDGTTRETATGMLQIHALIMSLNYMGIEIKTAHSLESWNRGVLVMVSGSVQVKNLSGKRTFMQTFFLAPQEKGYFVLNDIFHFVDEEPIHHHPAILLAQSNLDAKFNTSSTLAEPVSNYLLGGEIQARDFVAPADLKENGPIDNYSFMKQELQQVPEPENVLVDNAAEENGTLQNSLYVAQDQFPASVEEPVGEPQKQTYASILRVAKAQSAPSVSSQPTISKNAPPASESNHASQDPQQAIASSNAFEWSGGDMVKEFSAIEDEDEVKSVYVRSLLPTTSEAEIEEEFRKFGEIKPDGVVIRSRKDVGVCYAFVEFEDISGVHNAVRAGTAQLAGRPVYIEERRPNSIPYRVGRGRGRGRGSYQTDAPRGHFGARSLGRGSGYDGSERDYSRTRGNGYHRPDPRQDRGLSAQQVSRSVQYQSDYAA